MTAMKKKIGVTIDPELHAKVKSTAPLRGVNVEKAYAQALRVWLDEPPPPIEQTPTQYRPENAELHDKLERILNSGDVETINAVVPNIEVFYSRLKPGRPAGKTNIARPLAPEENRIIEEFRNSSYTKRQQILAFAAKPEDLSPEVMPPRKRVGGK